MTVLAKIRNFFKNTFNIIGCFITPACDEYIAGFKAYNYSKNEWKPFVTDALLQQVVIYNKHKINIYL